jgi:multidrug efflux system membrane fusion protein
VVAATASRGNMPVYLTGLGNVTAFNTVTVKSRVDGELVKIYFQEGQLVREGDPLAEIDPRPFQVQLEQAEGQMAKDQATLSNARTDLNRYEVLYKQDAIPQQQLATQQSTVVQDEAVLKSDQGAIDNAKLQLTYCHITSPLTGRVGLRLVDQGNIVHAADTTGLLVITQLQPIAVIFSISEDYLPQVRNKMRAGVALPVEAWDRDIKTKIASGTLLTIDNQVDQTTGTVKYKATFNNEDNALFPNQFVNARLLVDTKRGVVVVPSAAIQRSADSTFVWVVKSDGTVEVRNVTTSVSEADRTALDSGLMPGDVVVTDGVDKLEPGTKVMVRMEGATPSSATRPSGSGGAAKKGHP